MGILVRIEFFYPLIVLGEVVFFILMMFLVETGSILDQIEFFNPFMVVDKGVLIHIWNKKKLDKWVIDKGVIYKVVA